MRQWWMAGRLFLLDELQVGRRVRSLVLRVIEVAVMEVSGHGGTGRAAPLEFSRCGAAQMPVAPQQGAASPCWVDYRKVSLRLSRVFSGDESVLG